MSDDDYDEDSSETIRSCELQRVRHIERIVAQAARDKDSVRTVPFTTAEMAWVGGKWPSTVNSSLAVSYKVDRLREPHRHSRDSGRLHQRQRSTCAG